MTTSRRRFLAAAAALPAASTVLAQTPSNAWDETFDVVVVGSGVAGTIAAIAAAEKGAKVLMIEKLNRTGGTSRFSGLNFACVDSAEQKKRGVKDSPEALARDMFRVSGGVGNYELALVMAKNTARVEKFLTDRGVRWDGRLLKLGGHSAERCLIPEGDGAGLLAALTKYMGGLKNLTIRTSCKADEILFEKDRVSGLLVREGYVFSEDPRDDETNRTGTPRRIRALRAVIFATGGYARDRAFRAVEVPFLDGVSTTTSPGATAGALKTLVRAGARAMHLSLYRFAYPLPTEDMVWGVLIDPATGTRFMSEGASRNELAVGTLQRRLTNGDKKPFMIYDEKALGKFHNLNRVGRSLNGLNGLDGTMFRFDTIEALAAHYGADAQTVKKTLETYNRDVAAGRDAAFGKPLERTERKVEPIDMKGPFYGIVISPRLNYTPGGIRTNEKAQALDWNGNPIAGLYVAGEAAGGLHGQERMTACSMPDCSVFGLIAGENAAAEHA